MPESQSILIRGGRVIDPMFGFDQTADVLIADGVIRQISTDPGQINGDVRNGCAVIDAQGCIVSPGLIDIHVHFREPSTGSPPRKHRETIASGVASALNGAHHRLLHANTTPPLDSAAMVEFIHHKAALADGARVRVVGCASKGRKGEELAEIGAMAGAVAAARWPFR